MAKCTPGPWTYGYGSTQPDQFMITTHDVTVVAHVLADEERDVTGAQVEANARLIAAAPDLLAALIALKDHVASEMTFTRDDAGLQPDDLPLAQLLITAEDTISKATGASL